MNDDRDLEMFCNNSSGSAANVYWNICRALNPRVFESRKNENGWSGIADSLVSTFTSTPFGCVLI